MKNYLKVVLVSCVMFSIAAACENDNNEEATYEQLQEISDQDGDSTDGSEIKRPGGGNG